MSNNCGDCKYRNYQGACVCSVPYLDENYWWVLPYVNVNGEGCRKFEAIV